MCYKCILSLKYYDNRSCKDYHENLIICFNTFHLPIALTAVIVVIAPSIVEVVTLPARVTKSAASLRNVVLFNSNHPKKSRLTSLP